MIEEALNALTAAVTRNNELLESALANRDAASKPAEEPAPEKPKRGRPTKAAAAKAAPKFTVQDVQRALVDFLGYVEPGEGDDREECTPAMVKERKDFARAISAELGCKKVAECGEEHYEKVIEWIKAKHRGVDVNFDMDLEDLRNAEPETDDDDV